MTVRILHGHVLDRLRELEDESVHCVVTSPPYWGLRDYGVDGQLGLEDTPDLYLESMVEVFREVRRVLRGDGTAWVNMGDSYVGTRGDPWGSSSKAMQARTPSRRRDGHEIPRSDVRVAGLKAKDLVGMPWRVAFALQADGWWLRQDLIWSKPNPMPESIRDRCTKSHEYLFLLSKSERYHFDAEAIKEPASENTHPRRPNNGVGFGHGYDAEPKPRTKKTPAGWATGPGSHATVDHQTAKKHRKMAAANSGTKSNASFHEAMAEVPSHRNKRSVWTIPSEPFPEAHFATFPTKLVEPCILAGCPRGGTVLDPFGGAGTTGLVARSLNRNAILIELNAEYVGMADRRINGPLFADTGT